MENKSLLYPCASAARRVISLDGMWRFEFDPESNGMDAGWGRRTAQTHLDAGPGFVLRFLYR